MKRRFPIVWNGLVVLFVILATVVIAPKIRDQFTHPRLTPDMIAMGYIGVGLLIGVWLCAASVTSLFWFHVPIWFRCLTSVVILMLVIGYIHASAMYATSPHAFGGFVSVAEPFTFFGTLAAFTFPLLFTGHGYPGLIQHLWRRLSSKRNA